MEKRVGETHEMIRQMAPRLVEGRFVFRTVDAGNQAAVAAARATFVEDEGLSVIVPAGPDETQPVMRQITCDVASALDGVGLTAAMATALAKEGIPANVVAAHYHDHIFVPEDLAARAVEVLRARSMAE